MTVEIVNPTTHQPLTLRDGAFRDADGCSYPLVADIGRFCEVENYASSFGKQWNLFRATQLDNHDGFAASARRFFSESAWSADDLEGLDVLEVGSGAGRFSQVILERTKANLYSVDYSSAVEANRENNGAIAPDRFHLFQASIYDLPFPDGSFDKVFCFGVLQHTPDFEASVAALIRKAKPGAEIVVDFYPIRGFWTRINGKYMLRPLTRRMRHDRLLSLTRRNVPWMMKVNDALNRLGLHAVTRFIPIPDVRTLPENMPPERRREWMIMDTFDMLSPEHDHPQRLATVKKMFERNGATVTFSGFIDNGSGAAAVVRGVRRAPRMGS